MPAISIIAVAEVYGSLVCSFNRGEMQMASPICANAALSRRDSLPPVRIFIVVAKSRPDLYQYFVAGFVGVDNVEVILDRRFGGENPLPDAPAAIHGERRERSDVYDEMESRGFVIMRVPGA
jgi:hypothetical protein